MKSSRVGIILGILDIALVGVLGFFYLEQDRNLPRIIIEETGLVYREGMSEEELLTGVTAIDPEDGDVSSSLVIEKVVPDKEKGIALITYGARDRSGNLVKVSTSVKMQAEGNETNEE